MDTNDTHEWARASLAALIAKLLRLLALGHRL